MPIVPALVIAFITGAPIAGMLALAGMLFFVITGDAPIATVPSAMQYGVEQLHPARDAVLHGRRHADGSHRHGAPHDRHGAGMGRPLDRRSAGRRRWSRCISSPALSGSKAADIATVGSVMKAPLRHYGYPPTESVAVLAASAAMGETIPPSLMLLVLGSITTCRSDRCSSPGLLPAAVLALVLIVAVDRAQPPATATSRGRRSVWGARCAARRRRSRRSWCR